MGKIVADKNRRLARRKVEQQLDRLEGFFTRARDAPIRVGQRRGNPAIFQTVDVAAKHEGFDGHYD